MSIVTIFLLKISDVWPFMKQLRFSWLLCHRKLSKHTYIRESHCEYFGWAISLFLISHLSTHCIMPYIFSHVQYLLQWCSYYNETKSQQNAQLTQTHLQRIYFSLGLTRTQLGSWTSDWVRSDKGSPKSDLTELTWTRLPKPYSGGLTQNCTIMNWYLLRFVKSQTYSGLQAHRLNPVFFNDPHSTPPNLSTVAPLN